MVDMTGTARIGIKRRRAIEVGIETCHLPFLHRGSDARRTGCHFAVPEYACHLVFMAMRETTIGIAL
eukprot:1993348-Pyramimonas_sp.AAC.1